jgi:hypothetical protein
VSRKGRGRIRNAGCRIINNYSVTTESYRRHKHKEYRRGIR